MKKIRRENENLINEKGSFSRFADEEKVMGGQAEKNLNFNDYLISGGSFKKNVKV